jgi:hypothetical protein
MKMKCSGLVVSFGLLIGLFFVGFNFSASAQSNDLKSEGSPILKIDEGKTNVIKTESGYQLYRNGLPYYVKGVGGDVNLDLAVQIGANSIRTWGIDNAQQILDDAQKHGMTVMLGLWLQHERHGFDYNNTEKVKIQLEHFKRVIDKFKSHPALLMWGIGNELDLQYTNTNCWYAVQDIAKYAHEVDPNHPTSTVTAGLDSMEVQLIKQRAPDIDIYCVNTYGDIAGVPANISRFGWTGPYMITEWGVNGYWESPKTAWDVSIEQTSTEKKQVFFDRYNNYIKPNQNYCLGSYAFLWGAKQEYTETWFGLFSKDNLPTEPIDALEMVFKNKPTESATPTIVSLTVDNKKALDNIHTKAGVTYAASVNAMLGVDMQTNVKDSSNKILYNWKILAESTDKKSGGDKEEEAVELNGLIKSKKSNNIKFRAPVQEGAYRIFVSAFYNGKVAYANIPFYVDKRTEQDGQARFIQVKKQSMSDFK